MIKIQGQSLEKNVKYSFQMNVTITRKALCRFLKVTLSSQIYIRVIHSFSAIFVGIKMEDSELTTMKSIM